MVKKLRYYARFIVVCLLLKKMKLVRDLVRELSKLIGNYSLNLLGFLLVLTWVVVVVCTQLPIQLIPQLELELFTSL